MPPPSSPIGERYFTAPSRPVVTTPTATTPTTPTFPGDTTVFQTVPSSPTQRNNPIESSLRDKIEQMRKPNQTNALQEMMHSAQNIRACMDTMIFPGTQDAHIPLNFAGQNIYASPLLTALSDAKASEPCPSIDPDGKKLSENVKKTRRNAISKEVAKVEAISVKIKGIENDFDTQRNALVGTYRLALLREQKAHPGEHIPVLIDKKTQDSIFKLQKNMLEKLDMEIQGYMEGKMKIQGLIEISKKLPGFIGSNDANSPRQKLLNALTNTVESAVNLSQKISMGSVHLRKCDEIVVFFEPTQMVDEKITQSGLDENSIEYVSFFAQRNTKREKALKEAPLLLPWLWPRAKAQYEKIMFYQENPEKLSNLSKDDVIAGNSLLSEMQLATMFMTEQGAKTLINQLTVVSTKQTKRTMLDAEQTVFAKQDHEIAEMAHIEDSRIKLQHGIEHIIETHSTGKHEVFKENGYAENILSHADKLDGIAEAYSELHSNLTERFKRYEEVATKADLGDQAKKKEYETLIEGTLQDLALRESMARGFALNAKAYAQYLPSDPTKSKPVVEPTIAQPPPSRELANSQKLDRAATEKPKEVRTTQDILAEVKPIEQAAKDLRTKARNAASEHRRAMTFLYEGETLGEISGHFRAAADKYGEAMKIMQDESRPDLGSINLNDLDANKKALSVKADLYDIYANNALSKAPSEDMLKTVDREMTTDEKPGLTATKPTDNKLFHEFKKTNGTIDNMFEIEINFPATTLDGHSLKPPKRVFLHIHVREGVIASQLGSLNPEDITYAHIKSERDRTHGALYKQKTGKQVPEEIISDYEFAAMLGQRAVQKPKLGISVLDLQRSRGVGTTGAMVIR
jgi:hypothetical protein